LITEGHLRPGPEFSMRFTLAVLPVALALACGSLTVAGSAGAADAPTVTVASVADLASLFEGEFTTLPATASAAKPPPNVLYNLAKRVHVPSLGDEVVYAEQHQQRPDGPMQWQRLYAFKLDDDLGMIVMTPYDFANGEQLKGAYADPAPLAKLQPTALKQQPNGCVVLWRKAENGFQGTLKPGSCKDAPSSGDKDKSLMGKPAITVTKTEYTEQPQGGSDTPIVFRRLR
jgi:hypothetical protein